MLSQFIKNLHKTIIDNFTGLFSGIGIAQGDTHGIAIEMPVKHFQRLGVSVLGFLNEQFFQSEFNVPPLLLKTDILGRMLQGKENI